VHRRRQSDVLASAIVRRRVEGEVVLLQSRLGRLGQGGGSEAEVRPS
jgi:hypothetical protein